MGPLTRVSWSGYGVAPGESAGGGGRHDRTLSTLAEERCNRGRWMEKRGLRESSGSNRWNAVVNRV